MIVPSIKSWCQVKEFLNLRLVEVDLHRQKEPLKPQLYHLYKPAESGFMVFIHLTRKQREKEGNCAVSWGSKQTGTPWISYCALVYSFPLMLVVVCGLQHLCFPLFISFPAISFCSCSSLFSFTICCFLLKDRQITEGDWKTIILEVSCL